MATDGETWERIRRGDVQAFGEVYKAHGPRLEMFLRRLLGSRQAAEDVTQETFARIWQNPNGFEPERGSLRAYLFGAAKKRAANWWRKNGVPKEPVLLVSAECDSETVWLLSDAVARLSEEGRALIWLREVEGYSYDELAQVFDVPAGTVASRLFAAREELRAIWHAPAQQKRRLHEV